MSGSDMIKGHGLTRAQREGAYDPPEAFVVVDHDIGAHTLRALYAGSPVALAQIDGVLQARRNHQAYSGATCALPADFLASLYAFGAIESAHYIPIGAGSDGVIRNLMAVGSMRNLGLRDVNPRRVARGLPPWKLRAFPHTFTGTPAQIADKVRALKRATNMGVPLSNTAKAALAAEHVGAGHDVKECVGHVPGVSNAAEAQQLCDLGMAMASLSRGTMDACDDGRITIATAIKRAALSKEEQDKALLPRGERPHQSKPPPANGAPPLPTPRRLLSFRSRLDDSAEEGSPMAIARDIVDALGGNAAAKGRLPRDVAQAVTLALENSRPGRKPAKAGA